MFGSAVLLARLPACCLLFSFNCHMLEDFPPEGCLLAQARRTPLSRLPGLSGCLLFTPLYKRWS